MKSKGKRIQEIQENKIKDKKRELTGFDFLPKAKISHQKSYNSLQDWSLYRAPHEVKYHHALKKELNKEGKSGKRRKQNQKVNKREREHFPWHQFRTSAKFLHQGAKFLHRDAKNFVLFFFCSSSDPLLLLISNL